MQCLMQIQAATRETGGHWHQQDPGVAALLVSAALRSCLAAVEFRGLRKWVLLKLAIVLEVQWASTEDPAGSSLTPRRLGQQGS